MSALLSVENLSVDFHTAEGVVSAVRGIDLTLAQGEAVAVVGESGSGKSVTGRALLGLLPSHAEVTGSIRFDGTEVTRASERKLRHLRGTGVGMVFQDSLDSLNPVYPVGAQLTEVLRVRRGMSRVQAKAESARLLHSVGIVDPERRLAAYPHQFSGGMRQRVCIALAVALQPQLLIADEPTTALDVTVQAGILRLLADLQRQTGMSLLFVTHDLGVARQVASSIVVMRAGRIVETGAIKTVFSNPQHPYTRALFAAHPDQATTWRDLQPIDDDLAVTPEADGSEATLPGTHEIFSYGA